MKSIILALLLVICSVSSVMAQEAAGEEAADVVAATAAAQVTAHEVEETAGVVAEQARDAAVLMAAVELGATQVRARHERARRRMTLMLTGNISGQLAEVDCRQERQEDTLHWARHAAYFDLLQQYTQIQGRPDPVALSVGNALFPGVMGRYLLTEEEDGAARLAEIFAAVPMTAQGLGSRDFSVPRTDLVGFLEAMGEAGIAMQAANLSCESFGNAEAVCGGLSAGQGEGQPFEVVERDGVKMAIITVLAEDLLGRLASYHTEGLRVLDPKAVLASMMDEMRAQADLVIVQYQVPTNQAVPLSYQLGKEVEGIDLIIASHLIEDHTTGTRFDPEQPGDGGRMEIVESPVTGTPIVSANSAQYSAIVVELDLVDDTEGAEQEQPQWRLRRAEPRRILLENLAYHEPTRELMASSVGAFCEDWGEALGDHARITEPMDAAAMHQFVLNIMRFSTRSEVAIKNQAAFRNEEQFPLTEALTRADIQATLPFDNELVVAYVRGSVLRGLAGRGLVGAGITLDGGEVRINGRAVNDDRSYRVAINDYLAEGGDGIFSQAQLERRETYHPRWSAEAPTIDEIVVRYVEDGRHLKDGKERQVVSGTDNFPDLHRKFLWTFLGAFNAAYNQVVVRNPDRDGAPAYDQGQLTVQSTDQLNLEGRFAINGDSRNHGWNNDLNLQYAMARLADAEDSNFDTTTDQIRLRSRYRYKRLRADLAGRWYVPDPVVEGQLETEFRTPETRDWHRMDVRGILGASFQLLDPLDVRIGANVRQDINQPDSEPTWGLTASYTLARINLLRVMDRPIRFESEVEYFYNDIGRQNVHEMRSANRVFFALFNQFFFTTTFNAFLYRNDAVGELGTNTALTIGINYQWDMALQNF